MYTTQGIKNKVTRPGTIAAVAHWIQSTCTFRMLFAKERIRTLGAMAVRKV